jgi:hypothetical protein
MSMNHFYFKSECWRELLEAEKLPEGLMSIWGLKINFLTDEFFKIKIELN